MKKNILFGVLAALLAAVVVFIVKNAKDEN